MNPRGSRLRMKYTALSTAALSRCSRLASSATFTYIHTYITYITYIQYHTYIKYITYMYTDSLIRAALPNNKLYVSVSMYVCMYVYFNEWSSNRVYVCMHICMHVYSIVVYIYSVICMCALTQHSTKICCIYKCMYVFYSLRCLCWSTWLSLSFRFYLSATNLHTYIYTYTCSKYWCNIVHSAAYIYVCMYALYYLHLWIAKRVARSLDLNVCMYCRPLNWFALLGWRWPSSWSHAGCGRCWTPTSTPSYWWCMLCEYV